MVDITPEKIEYNFQEIPITGNPIQGMAIDAAPQPNAPATPTSGSNIVSGPGGSVLNGGFFQSPNYVVGVSGWKIDANGDVEFGSGKFRGSITGATGTFSGTITATTGTIGGWSISSTAIYFDGATDAVSSGMAPADYPFYAGKKYASRATAPFKVEPSGKLTVTDIVATGTINAQAGYLSAGVYVDTVNGLLCESGGLNVGTAGHIRGGATDYATGVGFFLGYSGGAYKFSVGNPDGKYINWTGTDFVVNGFVISSKGAFGGDSSDGALAITSGTTTLDIGAVSVYTKNYSSISITGTTGKLAFSNPAAGGTMVVLKSSGAVVLTSTIAGGVIDVSSMGAIGGAGVASGNDGNAGTDSNSFLVLTNKGTGGTSLAAGTGGATSTLNLNAYSVYQTKYSLAIIGAGGGSGTSNGGGTTGAGGRGGGALIIECAGDLNFPGTANVNCNGADGVAGDTNSEAGSGGGGGGSFICLYKTATSAAGVINVAGGTGANGNSVNSNTVAGGGGGGSKTAGANGARGTSGSASKGGNGGNGLSLIAANTELT